jgi:hypothetical protein
MKNTVARTAVAAESWPNLWRRTGCPEPPPKYAHVCALAVLQRHQADNGRANQDSTVGIGKSMPSIANRS